MARAVVMLGLALMLLSAAGVSTAQVPEKMDYQVMLTDAANQPIADQIVGMVFRIYDQQTEGTLLWTETRDVVTNSIGVASVILGGATPLGIDFSGPRWLEVQANGEILEPRRELVAAPFARQAHNADNLGGTAAGGFALSSTLSAAGTINTPGNPVDWTKLKSVPAGFADGTDNAGVGDGSSLDAPDGSPVDAIYVDNDGGVVVKAPTTHAARLEIVSEGSTRGLCVVSDSAHPFGVGVIAVAASTSGIVGNAYADLTTLTVPITPAGLGGAAWGPADGVYAGAGGTGDGAYCVSAGSGAAVRAEANGSGYSGYFEGGGGVGMERTDAFPVLDVHNDSTIGWGDAAWFYSPPGVSFVAVRADRHRLRAPRVRGGRAR